MALDIREDYVAFPPHMRYIGQTTGAPRHLVWDTIVHIAKDLMVTHSTDSRPVTSKDTRMDKDDGNYTGATGVAVALINLVIHAKRSAYITVLIQQNLAYTIDDAERLAQRIAYGAYDSAVAKVLNDPRRAITTGGAGWYCGFPGVIATMVKVAGVSGDTTRAAQGIVTLLQLAPVVASAAGGVANEILYGRAGYLTCLREVATCGVNVPSEINAAATLVINAIMADGRAKATSSWPLLWDFHGTTYLGAAHGVGGILHELLFWWDLISAIDRAAIVATLRQLARVCRDKAPAALDRHGEVPRNEEEIVHWCHGPGGLCAVFAKAATVLDDAALEESARLLGRRVTEKGILRKGMGLCHGVCGNAYALLALYRATGDHRYLHESVAMIEVGLSEECQTRAIATYRDPQRLVVGKPDTPLSLMEGDAGVLCCLLDILDPQLSAFPGFETTATAQPLHWLSWAQCPIDHPKPEPPQVVPGVWEVDLMDPSFCETFLQDVYSCFPAEKRKVDALRLGRRHEAVVRAITAVVQRFVHNVMVPADARRIKRFTSTTEDASPVDDEAGTDDEDTEEATDDEAPAPNAPNAVPNRKPLTAFERENLQKTREARKYRDSALMSIEMPQLRVWRAYIIRYDAINHPSINSHNDACDVTFNLCMKRTAEKGHLVFNESAYVHQHRPGTATIFWGDKVHHTHNVEGDGERAQLVLLLNFMRPDALGTPLRALEARGLNDPCLFEILLFLPVRDIASFSYANKRFYQVANESGLWYQLYRRNASLMHFRDTESLLVVPWCVNCKTVRGSEACASCHQPICTECFAINHANTCRACTDSQSAHRRDVQWYELSYSWKVPEYVAGVSHWKQVYHAALVQAGLAEIPIKQLKRARRVFRPRHWMATIGDYPMHNRARPRLVRATTGYFDFHGGNRFVRQQRMLQFGGTTFEICAECSEKASSHNSSSGTDFDDFEDD